MENLGVYPHHPGKNNAGKDRKITSIAAILIGRQFSVVCIR